MRRRKALTLIALGGVSPALAFAQGGGREAGGNLDDATRRYAEYLGDRQRGIGYEPHRSAAGQRSLGPKVRVL